MSLTPDACYRALASRDARFDGRIWVGVRTTGVYCRPVCPAPTPRLRNVRFFPSAAAAAEAGFRPCLRCRPETSPGTPAWLGSSASVSRALRLLAEDGFGEGGAPALAARLGMGERQLRRLFHQHLGTSPQAVLQTQRAHFAKRLLDETDLPITEIAFAAGFASVRRFNAAMREAWGRAPRELRRSPAARRSAGSGGLALRIACRPPFDGASLLAYLTPRAIPGVESVRAGVWSHAVDLDGFRGVVRVEVPPGADHLVLRVPAEASRVLAALVARVRRVFDVAADAGEIAGWLGRDPLLAPALARHPGLRVPGAFDGFELAVRAVLGQQVSVARASDLAGALVARFGTPLDGARRDAGDTPHASFPRPETLARARLERLGLPGARAGAIRALARAARDGLLAAQTSGDLEAREAALRTLPGVGPWTAAYVAMRALGEPDAFPSGDLGLRRAAGDGAALAARALEQRAQAWRPWRAYAAMALWLGPGSPARDAVRRSARPPSTRRVALPS